LLAVLYCSTRLATVIRQHVGNVARNERYEPQLKRRNFVCNPLPHGSYNKEDNVINDDESEDDTEPAIVLYGQIQALSTDEKSVSQRLYAAEIKPPPKIPIYILYGVFRV
jgi:hypothetical protein